MTFQNSGSKRNRLLCQRFWVGTSALLWLSTPTFVFAADPEPSPEASRGPSPEQSPADSVPGGEPSLPALRPLPAQPTLALPEVTEDDRQLLSKLLKMATSADAAERGRAFDEATGKGLGFIHTLRLQIDELGDRTDKEALKLLLSEIRQGQRSKTRGGSRASERSHEPGDAGRVDYLELLASRPQPDSRSWRDLVTILATSRLLSRVGSVEAGRELVRVYVRFGEFLRVNTQLELKALGLKGSAALIEATRHPAPKIAQWAKRQLELQGHDNASELVQTTDREALADLLRAYGRTRDAEIARLVISFGNSQQTSLREAAREAVVLLGETGHWQLRDTYENIVGKKPPREWSWERTARELFSEFDRLRLADVYALFAEGRRARERGNLDEMRSAYDRLLVRDPLFDERSELVAGYLDDARQHFANDPGRAESALRRAVRLSQPGNDRQRAESLLVTLEANRLLEQGVADQVLYRRALQLDPSNQYAAERLSNIEAQFEFAELRFRRYLGAFVILLAGGIGALYFFVKRRREGPAPVP